MKPLTETLVRELLSAWAQNEQLSLTTSEFHQLANAWLILNDARKLTAKQAEDEALWFDADYVTEAVLQKALRELAAAVEREKP